MGALGRMQRWLEMNDAGRRMSWPRKALVGVGDTIAERSRWVNGEAPDEWGPRWVRDGCENLAA